MVSVWDSYPNLAPHQLFVLGCFSRSTRKQQTEQPCRNLSLLSAVAGCMVYSMAVGCDNLRKL